jgi:isoleucyl-tRNA synthetase
VRDVFNRDGADAMRWFLMSSPILRGGNLVVTEQGIRDGVRQVIIPLWNTWYFFSLYANAFRGGQGYEAKWSTASTDPLDRYLLAKLGQYVQAMQDQLDSYEVANACETTRQFLDVLTNWYVRRSRERFWDTGSEEAGEGGAEQAFDTLYTALEVVSRVAAPLLPLTTEEIWRGLTGGRSVHLTDWPDVTDLPSDDTLVAGMDRAREICSAASSMRKAGGLRVRLPLQDLTVVTADAVSLKNFGAIIADEVNVRTVTLRDVTEASEADFGVSQRLTVNARAAGPRLGRGVQQAIKGSKSGDWSVGADGTVVSGGLELVEGEYTLETVVDESKQSGSKATAMLPGGGFVVLDTQVTPELAQEGLARDLVRAVQQARRDAGLDVSDRISLTVTGGQVVWEATVTHQALIVEETLATQFGSAPQLEALPQRSDVAEATVGDGEPVRIKVMKL